MQIIPLEIIARTDARMPNQVPIAQKLDWLNQLESRIHGEIKREYDTYTCVVDADKPYVLPCAFEQVERVFYNGKLLPKVDLRSVAGLPRGTYRVVYRTEPKLLADTVCTDAQAVFTADGITFSKPHPFAAGDLIGVSETAENNVTATVTAVENTTVTTDYDGFVPGEMPATVSKINDRGLEIPEHHACFGIYEEYLCMQIAKCQNDAERYRLAETAFEQLWRAYAVWYKQTAPQDNLARVRGI